VKLTDLGPPGKKILKKDLPSVIKKAKEEKIPIVGLISLLTLPIAFKTISILRGNYQDPVKMAPANLGMICTHNFTAILLVLAYFIEGFKSDALIASFLPVIILIILYIPIARLIRKALLIPKKELLTNESLPL
ncbi:MAG: hypothetical protein MUO28_07090, partial [Desulfobacterales bacterium]|nr:hypothetical protein [Desulfobacterales bacterium]